MSDVHRFKAHSEKQEKAIFADKRILLLGCGTQFGKTTVGALRMKRMVHEFTHEDDAFLITSLSYKHLYQSTLPPFLKLMDGYGRLDKQLGIFHINNGGKIYLRTETEPDSVVGITNCRHIWADEAGKYKLYFWENLQARADMRGCGIDLTTSPYALNWVYKEIIKLYRQGKRPDVEYISAASWENPYHSLHDPKARELKELTMDPRRFAMLYGGEFGKMIGLVYDCYDEDANQVEPFALPSDTRYVAGIDWGYTDPFVIKVRGITTDGRHYGVSEFHKTMLEPPQQLEAAKQLMKVWKINAFYADPSKPDMISYFNSNGVPTFAADNSIMVGVGLHYELLKTRRFKLFKGKNPQTIDELETYHYPEPSDLGPDDSSKEQKPVDQNNHCLDADRYLTISTYRSSGTRYVPKVPSESPKQETMEQKLAKLMKKKGGGQTENWS